MCDRVLTDPTVSRETLKNRAVGLKIIGTIYQKVKSDVTPEDIPIPITPPPALNTPFNSSSSPPLPRRTVNNDKPTPVTPSSPPNTKGPVPDIPKTAS